MHIQDQKDVKAFIAAALAQNCRISVHDGEEYTVKRSTDAAAIFAALETTDSDTLLLRDEDGANLGSVYLVHGNEAGVIFADWTDNEYINSLLPADYVN